MTPALPDRNRPAHFPTVHYPNRSEIVLLTVCTAKRAPILASANVVSVMVDVWRRSTAWQVGRYVIMPDHLHAFCAPSGHDAVSLTSWVSYWKSMVSKQWPAVHVGPIWQQNFWDRQLRNSEHYSGRWDYVRNNPVRHGLVTSADDWPWQGELNEFRFHD